MNVFTFTGNTTKDAEQRFTQSGDSVVSFTVAVNAGFGDKKKTSFVKCSMFGKRGESVFPYIKKGMKLGVSGEFSMNEWTNKDGQTVATPEVRVNEVDLPAKSSDAPAPRENRENSQKYSDFADDCPF